MRTIDWNDAVITIVDQTALPNELIMRPIRELDELIAAITSLAIRGAPALGVAGAMGVAQLAAIAARSGDTSTVRADAARLRAARPTAVNLSWGVDRALAVLDDGPEAVLAEALRIRDDDIAACVSMGLRGADYLAHYSATQLTNNSIAVADRESARPIRLMTICNTGGLAAVERGTALGVIQTVLEQGWLAEAVALETRPLLQGARLTAWELERMGAPFHLIVDSAGPFLLSRGIADAVLIGADRIAANGDTANKVGSFSLALAARNAGVPFIVVAPESTIDMSTPNGDAIEIEDRGAAEVVAFGERPTAPPGTRAYNPAFDVTPHTLIDAVITDRRVVRLREGETLAAVPLEDRLGERAADGQTAD